MTAGAGTTARVRLALEGATAVQQGLAKVEGSVSSAAKSIAGLAGGLSLAGFATWIKGAINAADESSKLAQKAGLAVNQVAGLQLAFGQSGVSAEQFVPIMSKLGVAVTNGSKALTAMGIASHNADGSLKSTRQVLGEVSDKFAGYQDGAAKTALAIGLLGEEGAKLLPLLNQGANGLDQYDQMAQQLGLTLDNSTAKAAEQFNDTLDLMGQATSGVARQVAARMLPTLNSLAGELFRSLTQGDSLNTVVSILSGTMKGLYSVAVGVVTAFKTVGTALGGVGAAIAALISGDFAGARTIISAMASDISASWASAGGSIIKVWESAGDSTVAALAQANAAMQATAPAVAAATKATDQKAEADRAAAAALKQVIAAAQSSNAAFDEEFKSIEDARTATEGRIKSAREMLESIERETALMGMSNDERERSSMLWELERQGVVAGTEAYDAFITKLDDARTRRSAAKAAQEFRQEQVAEWQKANDQITQSLTDSLFDGGKSFLDNLASYARTIILRPIIAPIGAAMANLLMPGSASAGQGGAGGTLSLSSLQNLLNPSQIFSSFGDSLAFAADSAGQWLVNNTSGMLNQLGGKLMGNANLIGTAGSYFAGAGAGIGLGRAISGGYSAIGRTGNTAVNAGTIIGAIFGGPIGGAIGGAIGGVVNRVFGRKLAGQGISGDFRDGAFTGSSWEYYKGGVFRDDKTTYGAIDPALQKALSDRYAAITSSTVAAATALGLNGDLARSHYATGMSIDFSGKSQQEIDAWFNQMFQNMADYQATMFDGLQALVREGETASTTLQALATSLTGVNAIFDTLGANAYQVSLAGGDMARQLADLFGGLEAFNTSASAYYQAFYSDAERTATATRQLTTALGALGLKLPGTRDQYRALVEAQDLTTEAGRSTYAALLGLAPAFASITEAITQTGSALADEINRLRGLAGGGTTAQGYAALQARFATTTAMARAGDAAALQALPDISKALAEAATLQASTAAELNLIRQQLAASLAVTMSGAGLSVPAFEVGTNYVPRTMLAQVHEGEAIVPKAYNPAAGGAMAGGSDVVTELRVLRQQLQEVAVRLEEMGLGIGAVAGHTAKTTRILERAQPTGDALLTMTQADLDAL